MKHFLFALTCVFALGCFHWAPITSLNDINDDRVRVIASDGHQDTLDHATATGHIVRGIGPAGLNEVSALGSHVHKWKVDWLATGLVIGVSVTVSVLLLSLVAAALVVRAEPADF